MENKIIELEKELKKTKAERDELKSEIERFQELTIESFEAGANGWTLDMATEMTALITQAMVQLLAHYDAENFVTLLLGNETSGNYSVTVQKATGKTLGEKYIEVCKERDRLLKYMIEK